MRNLVTLSDSIGGNLTGAGFALETIANLLGADGSEHFLNKDHINGLVHAVLTISVYVKDAGYSLCEAAEIAQEGGPMSAHDKLAMVAEEAIEQVRYSREQARWLDAVVKSIHDVLEGGRADVGVRISRAQDLASLASYLAFDLHNYSDVRVSDLQAQLDAAGGAQ